MKVPTLDYCCCGISLKTGTLLIGILVLVGSIGAFLNAFDFYFEIEDAINEQEPTETFRFAKIKDHLLAAQIYVYTWFFDTAMGVVLGALLLIGYCGRNRTLLRSWVIGILVLQVFEVVSNLSICVVFGQYLFMLYNLSALINLYFACVVNSYAQEVVKGSSSSIA